MWHRVPKKCLSHAELHKKLVVPETATFFREHDACYLVPRCYDTVPVLYRTIPPLPAETSATTLFTGRLLETEAQPQKEAVAKILRTWQRYPYTGILKLPPGTGKTVIAIAAAVQQKQPTLICVHTSVLMEQWCDRLRSYTQGGTIGRIRGKVCDIQGHMFVVAMLQTLYRGRHSIEPGMFANVIVDEVHHVVAKTYFQALMMLPIRNVLGLSATPRRTDHPALNRILKYTMGDIIFEVQAQSLPDDAQARALIFLHHSDSPICNKRFSNREQARFKYLQEMTLDKIRNLGIIQQLVSILRTAPTRQVLVLSHYVDHLIGLESLFTQIWRETPQLPPQPSTGIVHGKVKLKDRAIIFETRQVLFATYSLFKEGGDIARLDTLVLTLPAGNITQTAGRILRCNIASPPQTSPPKLILAIYNNNQYPEFQLFDHLRYSHVRYFEKAGFEIQQTTLTVAEEGVALC